jgi:hypothetical protein
MSLVDPSECEAAVFTEIVLQAMHGFGKLQPPPAFTCRLLPQCVQVSSNSFTTSSGDITEPRKMVFIQTTHYTGLAYRNIGVANQSYMHQPLL